MNIPFRDPFAYDRKNGRRREYAVRAFADACAKIRKDTPVTLARSGGFYVFALPEAFEPQSSRVVNAVVLRHLLDCLIDLNVGYLSLPKRLRPRSTDLPLMKSGVRYGRTVEWDGVQAMYDKQYGDCKSLTALDVAQRRMRGEQAWPTFRWAASEGVPSWHPLLSGEKTLFHILTEVPPSARVPSGYVDRSKQLGMGKNENAPIARRLAS